MVEILNKQTTITFYYLFIDTREVNCAEIAEERVPTFKDLLQQWFDEAAWHAPSLIFFDDIDRLIPAEVEVSILHINKRWGILLFDGLRS